VARILVVDDERDVRELFNITLKMAGHTTETAKDGVEAVDKLKDPLPDLILLDLMMPNMDGFAFLAHLRDRLENRPLRVLVATAKVLGEGDQRQLAMWPVVGVLSKAQLDIAQMVNVVGQALAKDPHRKNGRSKPASRPEKPARPSPPASSAPESATKPGERAARPTPPPAGKPGAPGREPTLLERIMAASKKPPGKADGAT
jgi:CheY-like chemotaxis protein